MEFMWDKTEAKNALEGLIDITAEFGKDIVGVLFDDSTDTDPANSDVDEEDVDEEDTDTDDDYMAVYEGRREGFMQMLLKQIHEVAHSESDENKGEEGVKDDE